MFHRITCPSCQHKFTIPEAAMGKLANCPNCQSPFQAGKSIAEAEPPARRQPAPAAGINKTMLGEVEPPIKYNCPRCKKPLESPAIEAGTKKPCPACGQRLQIPAAPPSPAPQPELNKTILAFDESNGNGSKKPAAPPVAAVLSSTIPAAPAAAGPVPSRAWPLSMAATATIAGGCVFVLGLLACVLAMAFSGPDPKMFKAQQDFANAQKELEELKRSIQQKEALMAQQKQFEADQMKLWDKMMEEHKGRQKALDDQRERDRTNLAFQNDQKLKAETERKRQQEQEEIDRLARERKADRDKLDLEMKTLKSQLDAANQRAQQATIIVSQPPPPVYYPPYHYRHYWGW